MSLRKGPARAVMETVACLAFFLLVLSFLHVQTKTKTWEGRPNGKRRRALPTRAGSSRMEEVLRWKKINTPEKNKLASG